MRISDWSSDVCSSDLQAERDGRQAEADHPLHGAAEQEDGGDPEQRQNIEGHGRLRGKKQSQRMVWQGGAPRCFGPGRSVAYAAAGRSEERRVGKEWVSTCRSRWSALQ